MIRRALFGIRHPSVMMVSLCGHGTRYCGTSPTQAANGGTMPASITAEVVLHRMQTDPAFRQQVLKGLPLSATQGSYKSVSGEEESSVQQLTSKQWRQLFVRTAAPFFGFGVCDNLIMISVGDLIDTHFGVTMGFSTMIAAGLGQACSDGAGITIQGTIESLADKMGLPNPHLTDAQRDMPTVLFWQQVFRTLGIISGCLFGLIPVFLFDTGNRPRLYDQLLGVLPEDQRRELSAKAVYVTFKEGDHIFKFGDDADAMYTIVQGEVSVVGRSDSGEPLEFCHNGPGSNLGIYELVFGHRCVADVVVVTPSIKLLKINRQDFEACSKIDEIRRVVTEYVETDDSFIVYRARYLKKSKSVDVDGI